MITVFNLSLHLGLETHGAVAYVPNLFGDEGILIIGGGKYNFDTNLVEEQHDHMISFKIARAIKKPIHLFVNISHPSS